MHVMGRGRAGYGPGCLPRSSHGQRASGSATYGLASLPRNPPNGNTPLLPPHVTCTHTSPSARQVLPLPFNSHAAILGTRLFVIFCANLAPMLVGGAAIRIGCAGSGNASSLCASHGSSGDVDATCPVPATVARLVLHLIVAASTTWWLHVTTHSATATASHHQQHLLTPAEAAALVLKAAKGVKAGKMTSTRRRHSSELQKPAYGSCSGKVSPQKRRNSFPPCASEQCRELLAQADDIVRTCSKAAAAAADPSVAAKATAPVTLSVDRTAPDALLTSPGTPLQAGGVAAADDAGAAACFAFQQPQVSPSKQLPSSSATTSIIKRGDSDAFASASASSFSNNKAAEAAEAPASDELVSEGSALYRPDNVALPPATPPKSPPRHPNYLRQGGYTASVTEIRQVRTPQAAAATAAAAAAGGVGPGVSRPRRYQGHHGWPQVPGALTAAFTTATSQQQSQQQQQQAATATLRNSRPSSSATAAGSCLYHSRHTVSKLVSIKVQQHDSRSPEDFQEMAKKLADGAKAALMQQLTAAAAEGGGCAASGPGSSRVIGIRHVAVPGCVQIMFWLQRYDGGDDGQAPTEEQQQQYAAGAADSSSGGGNGGSSAASSSTQPQHAGSDGSATPQLQQLHRQPPSASPGGGCSISSSSLDVQSLERAIHDCLPPGSPLPAMHIYQTPGWVPMHGASPSDAVPTAATTAAGSGGGGGWSELSTPYSALHHSYLAGTSANSGVADAASFGAAGSCAVALENSFQVACVQPACAKVGEETELQVLLLSQNTMAAAQNVPDAAAEAPQAALLSPPPPPQQPATTTMTAAARPEGHLRLVVVRSDVGADTVAGLPLVDEKRPLPVTPEEHLLCFRLPAVDDPCVLQLFVLHETAAAPGALVAADALLALPTGAAHEVEALFGSMEEALEGLEAPDGADFADGGEHSALSPLRMMFDTDAESDQQQPQVQPLTDDADRLQNTATAGSNGVQPPPPPAVFLPPGYTRCRVAAWQQHFRSLMADVNYMLQSQGPWTGTLTGYGSAPAAAVAAAAAAAADGDEEPLVLLPPSTPEIVAANQAAQEVTQLATDVLQFLADQGMEETVGVMASLLAQGMTQRLQEAAAAAAAANGMSSAATTPGASPYVTAAALLPYTTPPYYGTQPPELSMPIHTAARALQQQHPGAVTPGAAAASGQLTPDARGQMGADTSAPLSSVSQHRAISSDTRRRSADDAAISKLLSGSAAAGCRLRRSSIDAGDSGGNAATGGSVGVRGGTRIRRESAAEHFPESSYHTPPRRRPSWAAEAAAADATSTSIRDHVAVPQRVGSLSSMQPVASVRGFTCNTFEPAAPSIANQAATAAAAASLQLQYSGQASAAAASRSRRRSSAMVHETFQGGIAALKISSVSSELDPDIVVPAVAPAAAAAAAAAPLSSRPLLQEPAVGSTMQQKFSLASKSCGVSKQAGRDEGSGSSSAAAAAADLAASAVDARYTVWGGFVDQTVEDAYVRFKHRQMIGLDYFAGAFYLLYWATGVRRFALSGDYASMMFVSFFLLFKQLPYVVLFSSRYLFLEHREKIILVCELMRVTLMAAAAAHLLPAPVAWFNVMRNMRMDAVIVSMIKPCCQHLRLRQFASAALLDCATVALCLCTTSSSDCRAAALRWLGIFLLATLVVYFIGLHMRRSFVDKVLRKSRSASVC